MLNKKHLIAGDWIASSNTFLNTPIQGEASAFPVGDAKLVDRAATAAELAFESFASSTAHTRAGLVRNIADEIDARAEALTSIGVNETGLPEARLESERSRTTGQLRMFADLIERGEHIEARHDIALPNREPMPRPDLKMFQRPIGPVAIFGAANFPLAFSVAGGDTASALAAGCTVVVKGHPAHPGTSEVIAQSIDSALRKSELPPGIFSLIQGNTHSLSESLVQHPLIQAVGFTGSLKAGRAMFDLCAARDTPIPFYGELGSINPMFILKNALEESPSQLAQGWAGSLTMGAGQFCTNPGVVFVPSGPAAEVFVKKAKEELRSQGSQVMLTPGIASAYADGCTRLAAHDSIEILCEFSSDERSSSPFLGRTTAAAWLANPDMQHEVFGAAGLIVTLEDANQLRKIATSLSGQLTATLHISDQDEAIARSLLPIVERIAGRLLVNGFPTGVEVCESMVHGGPYPASTNFGHTSVGTLAIRRWLRPVCYQNMPDYLLPVR